MFEGSAATSPIEVSKLAHYEARLLPWLPFIKTAVCFNIVNRYNLDNGVGIQFSKFKAVKQGLFQYVSKGRGPKKIDFF